MIIKDEVKLGSVNRVLDELVRRGDLTASMGAALRSVVSSVFRTVFGTVWRDMTVENMDINDVFDRFIREKGDFSALDTYRVRFRRAMELYCRYNSTIADKNEDNVKMIEQLAETINAAQAVLLGNVMGRVFNPECSKDYELYAIPTGRNNMAALALPKNMTKSEVDKISDLLEGILICSRIKKGGKM